MSLESSSTSSLEPTQSNMDGDTSIVHMNHRPLNEIDNGLEFEFLNICEEEDRCDNLSRRQLANFRGAYVNFLFISVSKEHRRKQQTSSRTSLSLAELMNAVPREIILRFREPPRSPFHSTKYFRIQMDGSPFQPSHVRGLRWQSYSTECHFPSAIMHIEEPTFNIAEVEEIAHAYKMLTEVVEESKAHSGEELQQYIVARSAFAAKNEEHDQACFRWAESCRFIFFPERQRKFQLMLQKIQNRFTKLGFLAEDIKNADFDIDAVMDVITLTGIARLTTRRFSKLHPLIEPAIAEATARRLG
ncbi:hypothetical protein BDZ97DRAFT_1753126 [Flammula alnicola]|nr:hypothetical protein BDZ97DRAFT_1753126 [Flammula alnicola]